MTDQPTAATFDEACNALLTLTKSLAGMRDAPAAHEAALAYSALVDADLRRAPSTSYVVRSVLPSLVDVLTRDLGIDVDETAQNKLTSWASRL